jgi:hypothetical protein
MRTPYGSVFQLGRNASVGFSARSSENLGVRAKVRSEVEVRTLSCFVHLPD